MSTNPLLQDWAGPHGLPPFADIQPAHFQPAFDAALAAHRAEVDTIAAQAEAPTFANTLAAFDASGRLLTRLAHAFYTLAASATSPELQAQQRALAAPLAAHNSAVYMHAGLFARVDALFEQRERLGLSAEQRRLLERVHLDFLRAGARLAPDAKARYAAVMARLAELNTRFAQNVLASESGYQLRLTTEAELAGLPGFVRAAARQAAVDRGLAEGVHVITLSRSLIVPFLSFSARRDLREQAWRAWVGRGDDTGDTDNRAICRQILELRAEQAQLHGHACYADFALEDTMARRQGAVMDLLERVWHPALAAQAREREAVLGAMAAVGANHALEPWDWRFYAEQAKRARFELDEAEVKPYFPLDRMVAAMFDCAGRLFGLQFKPRPDIAGYHADVRAFEVLNADGSVRGLFLQDNFARPTKRSGAWMNALRNQSRALGATPVILNNNNFARGQQGPQGRAAPGLPPKGDKEAWGGPALPCAGQTRPVADWLFDMITVSSNEATSALVAHLHARGAIRREQGREVHNELHDLFAAHGLPGLRIANTQPDGGWGNGAGAGVGQIQMTAWDALRLMWRLDADAPVQPELLRPASRAVLRRALDAQKLHHNLSSESLRALPGWVPGIPCPPARFAHKTGNTQNYASDAGIVHDGDLHYLIAVTTSLGTRYAPHPGASTTWRLPALGGAIHALLQSNA